MRAMIRQFLLFGTVGGFGLVVGVDRTGMACLWISHYLLGFTSLLADNISSNVIGLALGTAFRFWLYRTWVFRAREAGQVTTSIRPTNPHSSIGGTVAYSRLQSITIVDDSPEAFD